MPPAAASAARSIFPKSTTAATRHSSISPAITICVPLAPASIVNTVPTSQMTQGNFSQISQVIYDPATTVGLGRFGDADAVRRTT